MKKLVGLLLSSTLLFVACNNDKPKDGTITVTDKEGKETISVNPAEVKDAMQDMQQRKEELSNLTPLTPDELKALVPEELMGGLRTDLDVDAAMGAIVASADYIIKDSLKLKLDVVDCAGPGGAGMFGMQYMGMLNINTDDENEYVKTIDFNGGKAVESCKKRRNRCTLTWFSGNRYMISLQGDNVGIDALKDAAKGLDIK